MKTRFTCAALVPALLLAACSRSANSLPPNSPFSTSAIARHTANAQPSNVVDVHVLHSFGNGTDGSDPESGLLPLGGMLYGTTLGGGSERLWGRLSHQSRRRRIRGSQFRQRA